MARHTIDGIIEPKYGNYIRITAKGDDLEDVLHKFTMRARFVSKHTEQELREFKKQKHPLLEFEDG